MSKLDCEDRMAIRSELIQLSIFDAINRFGFVALLLFVPSSVCFVFSIRRRNDGVTDIDEVLEHHFEIFEEQMKVQLALRTVVFFPWRAAVCSCVCVFCVFFLLFLD